MNHLSKKEREYYKPLIIEYIIKAIKNIIEEYIDFEIDIDMKDECETILSIDSNKITSNICKAMKKIIQIDYIREWLENFDSYHITKYFIGRLDFLKKKKLYSIFPRYRRF